MDAIQIHTTFNAVLYFISKGQLNDAIENASQLTNELQIGTYTDRLTDLQQNYHLLLHYYSSGIDDPQRKTVYNKLIARLFQLNSELHEELMFRNSTSFEYSQKRYFPHTRRFHSSPDLFGALIYFFNQSELLKDTDNSHTTELKRLRSNYELLLPEIFKIFWLTTVYTQEEKTLFHQIFNEPVIGHSEKCLVVSGLTLNLWRMFDENKLMMLLALCEHTNTMVSQRAMVGLSFVLAKYNQYLPYFPAIRNRLVLMSDNNQLVENFSNIFIQLISTSETEKISKKMQEEILPEMMKISPKIKDKLDGENINLTDEWNEENPEWQEMLEKSGISDKLKELSDLQLEGADVYMSTFSLLKNFPFFNEMSNWFLPFDSQYSAVNELFVSDDNSLMSAFSGNNIMCNSDKFSFCLSILQMPESQRGMLKHSFKMEAEQLKELTEEEAILHPVMKSKNISKLYIQDLFRFFKLFPQHTDFNDMFDFSLKMHQTFLFDILTSNSELKVNIAEYYFAKNHYSQALELFEEIQQEITPTAALYQKIGYMYQQTTQFEKALDAYNKADIIQPDDSWTVRKMALCFKLSGNFEKALEFYKHADHLKPQQKNTQMQIGSCLIQLKKYKEALNVYLKLDAKEDENLKVWRAIVWCSFVSGNIAQAEYYSTKILNTEEPNALDYLNAGHIAWCKQKITFAIEFYLTSIKLYSNKEVFMNSFSEDKMFLESNGIDKDEIPLMIDTLFEKI